MNDARVEGTRDGKRAALLSARWLCKYYGKGPSSLVVLNNLNLKVEEGELLAIVGASGVGKSTLLHLLGGLDRPTSGTVEIYGFDIFSESGVDLSRFRNEVVGFMFQFHHLLPEFTALENVMMPMLIGGLGGAESRSRAAAVLERVSLGDRLNHRPAELSGGEQQRVALARGLARDPRILLADEPTGNLDSKSGDQIFGLLRELLASKGLTALVVTHNERLAARCDRVLHLEDGFLR